MNVFPSHALKVCWLSLSINHLFAVEWLTCVIGAQWFAIFFYWSTSVAVSKHLPLYMPLRASTSYICTIQFHILCPSSIFSIFLANTPERVSHLKSFLASVLPISLIVLQFKCHRFAPNQVKCFLFFKWYPCFRFSLNRCITEMTETRSIKWFIKNNLENKRSIHI